MSMMWVKKQSKWAIVAAALLIGGSLIMMDLPSSQGMGGTQSVGKVDGEEIPTMAFQQDLQNMLRSEEARTGRQPVGAAFAEARNNLFQFRVQNILLQRLIRTYHAQATVEEMQDWLLRNPRDVGYTLAQYEGTESVPLFLRDSTLDIGRYQYWLSQDTVYDRTGMRVLEQQLRQTIIPQLQMQQVFRSQVHRTDLEEAFALQVREDKAALQYYRVPLAAFPAAEAPDKEALQAHFEANPDSFWFRDEAARLNYVRLPLRPSEADTALMRDFSAELRERAVGGEDFADLARSYSSDTGTADNGGRLPASSRAEWVPAFAAAAFALSPGETSDPVLTAYGYHIIRMHGKTRDGGVEKAEVSHILLTITAGTETLDSILSVADAIKEEADASGLETAAQSAGLNVVQTPIFEKGFLSPLGAYVQGVSNFAFSPTERKADISEPLQNEEGVYILERDAKFPQGRDFERAREAVTQSLTQARSLEAARAEAERARAEVTGGSATPARIGEAVLESTPGLIVGEAYATGFGFDNASLFQAIHQKQGEWGPVLSTPEGAVFARVTETQSLSAEDRAKRIENARYENDLFQTSTLYQSWAQEMPKSVKVENYLDEVYRN